MWKFYGDGLADHLLLVTSYDMLEGALHYFFSPKSSPGHRVTFSVGESIYACDLSVIDSSWILHITIQWAVYKTFNWNYFFWFSSCGFGCWGYIESGSRNLKLDLSATDILAISGETCEATKQSVWRLQENSDKQTGCMKTTRQQ